MTTLHIPCIGGLVGCSFCSIKLLHWVGFKRQTLCIHTIILWLSFMKVKFKVTLKTTRSSFTEAGACRKNNLRYRDKMRWDEENETVSKLKAVAQITAYVYGQLRRHVASRKLFWKPVAGEIGVRYGGTGKDVWSTTVRVCSVHTCGHLSRHKQLGP